MTPELRFACALLAAWRLTHLLAEEDGPGDVVLRLRGALGDSLAGRAMDCFYCLSLWVAAPLAFTISADPVSWGVAWLAISGGACLFERMSLRSAKDPPQTSRPRPAREDASDGLLWRSTPGHEVSAAGAGVRADRTRSAARAGREDGHELPR